MFNNLGDRFQDIFKKVSGQGKLTEANIKDALREVRLALLEADVNYGVAKNFVAKNTGLKVVDTGAVKEDYAIAIAKGNKELLDKVNTGLKTLKENGKYDELIAKWFK